MDQPPTQQSNIFREHEGLSGRRLRLALLLGIAMYGGFGLLDIYHMASNYEVAWFIRFAVVIPLLVITFALSFWKKMLHFSKVILFLLMSFGQFGIIFMIALSKPTDPAYFTYYAGLILVMLWASFVFMLKFRATAYIAISTVLFYNIFAIWQQKVLLAKDQEIWSLYLGNNYFLISSAILVLIAAYQLDSYFSKISLANQALAAEQQRLKIAKDKAEESDRLKTVFLQNMSHEIRTPMNGILGFIDIMKEPDLTKAEQDQYFDIVVKSGERLLSTINDIIEISKIETGQTTYNLSVVSVNERISFFYEFFRHEAAKKGNRLVLTIPQNTEAVRFETDVHKLDGILTNLIKNAIKFTQKGEINIGYTIEGKVIRFFVNDTGIGIPKDKQQQIFDRFVQANLNLNRQHEGSGLGLSIVKAYADLMKGKVWVESEVGVGSSFNVELPFTPVRSETNAISNAKNPNNMIPKNYTVLIAEDDIASVQMLKLVLAKMGIECLTAFDGAQTIEMVKKTPKINLILMDLKMPVLSGLDATRQIRKFNPTIPIIAQTAYALAGDREMALSAGCSDYITKPVKSEKLFEVMSRFF